VDSPVEAVTSAAIISDLDGTIADLPIDWAGLRRELRVTSIDELWSNTTGWSTVSEAELRAAQHAPVHLDVVGVLRRVPFVVLTANSAAAAHVVAERTGLEPVAVLGREQLRGSKRSRPIFDRAIHQALSSLGTSTNDTTYLGDADYELEYAEAVGLTAIRIEPLSTGPRW
jgi:phosphoglycolate phosphatase-like HAD superfamily hydrolase